MLTVVLPELGSEEWDEINEEFISHVESEAVELHFEHSLVSLSKWESKWHKPFLGRTDLTEEESMDYIRCMLLDDVDPSVLDRITPDIAKQIRDYMDDPMTATTFKDYGDNRPHSREATTSEIIYYWMISYNIPVEFENWHIKRLLTLIRVCSIKNAPAKKKSKIDTANEWRSLNTQRLAKLGTKG